MKRDMEHVAGCLLGGAIGDAMGAPVEALTLEQIRSQYGHGGVTEPILSGRVAYISDETQLTLFTTEGLLRGHCRAIRKGICNPFMVVHHAYLRWLHTQGRKERRPFAWGTPDQPDDGWLIRLPQLHADRQPGKTVLAALESGDMGTIDKPINHSKGCGGVVRVAPVGLMASGDLFDGACKMAAITHGHPTGYLAAGVFATIIECILRGLSIQHAIREAVRILIDREHNGECTLAIEKALGRAAWADPCPEVVESFGQGFLADEALAIAIYCSLVAHDDFAAGVRLAINHGGDSDSTGSMTGQILGAYLGKRAIPDRWLANLELAGEIEQLAEDVLTEHRDDDAWWERYPGW